MSTKISKFFKKMKSGKKSEDLFKKSKSALDEQFIRFGVNESADLTLAPASTENTLPPLSTSNLKGMKRFSKSILALGQKSDKKQKNQNGKTDLRQNSSCSNLCNSRKSPPPVKSITPSVVRSDILAIDACMAFNSGLKKPQNSLPPKPPCARPIDIEPYANFSIHAGNNSENDESLTPLELSESDNSFGLTKSPDSSEQPSSDLGLENYMSLATDPTTKIDATYANMNSLTFVTDSFDYYRSRQSMPNLSRESENHIYASLESEDDTDRAERANVASTDSNDYINARQSMPNISKSMSFICEHCSKVCKNKAGLSSHQRLSKECKQIRATRRFSSVAVSP